jgi:hypothetical protein
MIGPDEINSPENMGPPSNITPFMAAPTVGRIVHYQSTEYNPEQPNPMAAIVIGLNPNTGKIVLKVFAMNGEFTTDAAAGGPDGNTPTQGCWNWPPRS